MTVARRLKALGPRVGALKGKLSTAKRVDPFYRSAGHEKFREEVFALYGRRCCVPGCETPEDRVTADHLVERRDGGDETDAANGRPLCHRHHLMKTAAAKRIRSEGRGGDQA